MLDAFRNVIRRGLRSILAMFGVAVGVFSFLVVGSMAFHFYTISFQFKKMFSNRVFVCEKPSFWAGGGILSQNKVKKVERVKGVREAVPILISRLKTKDMILFGIPYVVVGVPPHKVNVIFGRFPLLEGDGKLKGNMDAIVGYNISKSYNLKVGDKFPISKGMFRVRGIYQKTGSLIDGQIFVPLSSAQKIFYREGLINTIVVLPEDGVDIENLAKKIEGGVGGVSAISPKKFKAQVDSSLAFWNAIALGVSVAGVLSGILGIVVVLSFSVWERIKEIGLKKAIGATSYHIFWEFLSESLIISFGGWILGVLMGWGFIVAFQRWLRQMGTELFSLTLPLLILSFVGAVLIGGVAGTFPALKASKIDPIKALRH